MSDLFERLEAQPCKCDTERVEGMTYPHVINQCIRCHSIDALEAMQGHYERIKSQACLCRFDKASGEGEPGTVPSSECQYHRAMRERIEQLEAALQKIEEWASVDCNFAYGVAKQTLGEKE